MVERPDLRNFTLPELTAWAESRGMEAYRGEQVFRWIHTPGIDTFDRMTNLAKKWRERLKETAILGRLNLLETEASADGTRKFLFELEDGERIESVLIPERGHYTLCISSQVGCAQGCLFCFTAKMGWQRNLTCGEIVNQVLTVKQIIQGDPLPLTNVVLMGMGEPLANLENVLRALGNMLAPTGLQLSHRHLTLSTAGLVPAMKILGERSPVSLAVSLNAADDGTRDFLMPVNRKYPLANLMAACRAYPLPRGRRITFEYILIEGVNDSPESARDLANLLQDIKAKINLIPFNPHPGSDFQPPLEKRILAFQESLVQRHYTAIIRRSKGVDISAACGQLHAKWTEEERSRVTGQK